MRRSGSIRLLFSFAAAVILSIFLTAVFISPLALRGIGHLRNVDWIELSIILQIRDTRHSRWAEMRSRHYELMRMALDEPPYMNAFSWPDIADDAKHLGTYINLLFALWEMQ